MNVDIFAMDDLYELREIRELAVSPDSSKALYIERQFGHGQYHSFDPIWPVSTEGSRAASFYSGTVENNCLPICRWEDKGTG